ncbi:uncharacterized protein G2W53_016554 [Senna tora]|uniref:Uncharacterized protein n=1 Tax=Senna tora TaxID=362788 RepID=A0A834TP14_9FABA|nr:uncharacterized protein G2W53_016554 [Senna tora]
MQPEFCPDPTRVAASHSLLFPQPLSSLKSHSLSLFSSLRPRLNHSHSLSVFPLTPTPLARHGVTLQLAHGGSVTAHEGSARQLAAH